MELSDSEIASYRAGVGIMLLNPAGRAFMGRRIDMPAGLAAWQMPQGGIDPGETPEQAALRELHEEVGTDKAEILGISEAWHHYDLPDQVSGRMWGGRYRGQRQRWFAMRFTGVDADINPATEHPEFDAWEWVEPEQLPEMIVPFKRPIYAHIVEEFRPFWSALRQSGR